MYSSGVLAACIKLGIGMNETQNSATSTLLDDPAENAGQMLAPFVSLSGLNQLGLYPSAVTGAADIQLAVQGVNAGTGLPDGVDVATTGIFNATAGAWAWVNTSAPFSWAAGLHRFIIVRQHPSAVTPLGAGANVTLRGITGLLNRFPPSSLNGALAAASQVQFLAAWNSGDPSQIIGLPFISQQVSESTAANANEIVGLRFVSPLTGTPCGCLLSAYPGTPDGTHRVGVYTAEGGAAVCETETLEEDWGTSWAGTNVRNTFPFSTVGQVVAGTTYYLGARSISAALSVIKTASVAAAAYLNIAHGGAASNIMSVWNGSTWTDNALETAITAEIYFSKILPLSGSLIGGRLLQA